MQKHVGDSLAPQITIRRARAGHPCGYVLVPADHPWSSDAPERIGNFHVSFHGPAASLSLQAPRGWIAVGIDGAGSWSAGDILHDVARALDAGHTAALEAALEVPREAVSLFGFDSGARVLRFVDVLHWFDIVAEIPADHPAASQAFFDGESGGFEDYESGLAIDARTVLPDGWVRLVFRDYSSMTTDEVFNRLRDLESDLECVRMLPAE